MRIEHLGIIFHLSLEEAIAVSKLLGSSSTGHMVVCDMTEEERTIIYKIYDRLSDLIQKPEIEEKNE